MADGINVAEQQYDAILIVSFGGPAGPDDVIPFLENVLRGRNVPRERMLEVADHYNHFGGVSPINQQCRELIQALGAELVANNVSIPIYWGNRNWQPLLPDVVKELKHAGAKRVLALVTSGFSSYSGCRQYRENLIAAQAEANAEGIQIDKVRVFYNHPDFIAVNAQSVGTAIGKLGGGDVHVAFTAHSIPGSMAATSDYEKQLTECCRLVAERLDLPQNRWELVYQSRSGRPQDPWLEPDICDYLAELSARNVSSVVISPIGFLSDHIEVLYDLDDEAAKTCAEHGMNMVRASTPGTHPQFITMLRKLIQERTEGAAPECIGRFGPNHNICPADCCPAPQGRPIQPISKG